MMEIIMVNIFQDKRIKVEVNDTDKNIINDNIIDRKVWW